MSHKTIYGLTIPVKISSTLFRGKKRGFFLEVLLGAQNLKCLGLGENTNRVWPKRY